MSAPPRRPRPPLPEWRPGWTCPQMRLWLDAARRVLDAAPAGPRRVGPRFAPPPPGPALDPRELRRRRLAAGYSQRRLAARLGVSRSWLAAVERGRPRGDSGWHTRSPAGDAALLAAALDALAGMEAPP